MAKADKSIALANDSAPPAKSLFDRVAEYLDANDWRYRVERERSYFSMECRIAETTVRVVLNVTEGDQLNRILALSAYPIFVPENRRAAVLKAMNEINFALVSGCFEMDPADGQIRFRTSVESDTDIAQPMIDRVLNANLASADKHFAELMSATFGAAGPEGSNNVVTRPADATLQ